MSASPPPGATLASGCPHCPGTGPFLHRVMGPGTMGQGMAVPACPPPAPACAAPRGPLACQCDLGCVRSGFVGHVGRGAQHRAGAWPTPSLGGYGPGVGPRGAFAWCRQMPGGLCHTGGTLGERGPGCRSCLHPLTPLLPSPTPAEDIREKATRKAVEAGECYRGPGAPGGWAGLRGTTPAG